MSSCLVFLSTKIRKSLVHALAILLLAIVQTTGSLTFAQQRGGASAVVPRTVLRERSRSMDDYYRELHRMKVAELVSSARRRNLLQQINEDFHRIQVVHDEIILMMRSEEGLKYGRLIELSTEMKKRSKRLRANLSLPVPEGGSENIKAANLNGADVKESLFTLHDAVVSFVKNPIFQHLGLLDMDAVNRAGGDLKEMILLSDRVKNSAEALQRAAVLRKP